MKETTFHAKSGMYLNVSTRTPVARQCESDFVVQMFADILVADEFGAAESEEGDSREQSDAVGTEFVVGRVWAERLDWMDAEECGFPVLDVCNAASGTWTQVLATLSNSGGRSFRKELNLEEFVSEIVFVHEVLLHPDISDRVAVVDAALSGLSTGDSLILMHHEQCQAYHLQGWECRDLGFKKIARSNLLIRDNHYRYPFGDSCPAGREVEFVATAEHENWLLEKWDDLILDHPAL